RKLQWIIVGGESAQGRRPTRAAYIAWARDAIAQCRAAGVPVFVKQLGAIPREEGCEPRHVWFGRNPQSLHRLMDRAGADPAEWPEDLRVRGFPE
ncbi:MAG: DUF5131 family protein, partial [Betaproteobacteria bacterium]|nr:DUF5131 family protein [Betaproteobacteria bacterium]